MSPPVTQARTGHSPEWQLAYVSSGPEDSAQRELVAQLALPMNADQTREQAKRVQTLEAQITLMAPATAQRMYGRLTQHNDALGDLFHLTLHPQTISTLLSQLDAKRHELNRSLTPETHATANRGTQNTATQNRATPPVGPTRPRDQQPPTTRLPPPPPKLPQPRTTTPLPWQPPWMYDPQPDSQPSGRDWTWSVLTAAASMLGMTVSVGVRAIPSGALAKAFEAAWIVFQTTEGAPAAVVGMAGEAAAEALLPELLGIDAAAVRNLNELATNFPLLDLSSSRWLASVKTRGVLSTLAQSALTKSLRSAYTSDLLNIITGQSKLEDAAEKLLANRGILGQAWPRDLRATTVDGVVKYIREKSVLLVPSDHVQLLRGTLGEDLYRRLAGDKRALDQLGITGPTDLSKYISRQVDRIQSIGLSSGDVREMAETVHHFPENVQQQFRLKHKSILEKQRR
jgi:hypothetical protein